MKTRNSLYLGVAAVAIALAFGVCADDSRGAAGHDRQRRGDRYRRRRPRAERAEAGVWVIAETTDLPTKMNKTVVTDDQGRYLIPDLPKATTSYGRAATGSWTRPNDERTRQDREHYRSTSA